MRWVAAIGLLRHRFGVRPVPPPNALRSPACTAGRRTREGLSPNAAAGADNAYRCGRSISATPRRLTAKAGRGHSFETCGIPPGGARPTSTATRAARLRLRSELSVSSGDYWPTAQSCRLQPSTTALRKDGKHWWRGMVDAAERPQCDRPISTCHRRWRGIGTRRCASVRMRAGLSRCPAASIRISSGASCQPNKSRATLPGCRTVAQDLWLCARKNRTISAEASGPLGSV